MRGLTWFIVLAHFSACTPSKPTDNSVRYSDDYVLVEFAAKLEEESHGTPGPNSK